MSLLDHLSIQCTDVPASAAFYDAVLAPLGGVRVMDFGMAIGSCATPTDGNNVEAVCHQPETS